MVIRTVNKKLMNERLKTKTKELVAVEANCSASLIEKLSSQKGRSEAPKEGYGRKIAAALGVDYDDLFPLVKSKAS